jgi:assimilatory nitrate reductase catalytic subunit
LAGLSDPDAEDLLHRLLPETTPDVPRDHVSYHDAGEGASRTAAFEAGIFAGALYVSSQPLEIARTWLVEQLGSPGHLGQTRAHLLAGRPLGPVKDRGPIVCACFGVGRNEIADALRDNGCRTVGEIGKALKAGTNCGSCRSEISRIIAVNAVER